MANAGAIDAVLVPGCRALAPAVFRNGGTYTDKTGYHNSRNNLRRSHPSDYSIQEPKDKLGPGDKGSAFDWTFEDARLHSDFRTINKFSKRLYEAGVKKDPRAYPLREFFGNTDPDRTVEGYSYFRGRPVSSDPSHLWHIHFSIWRRYIDDVAAMRSILSILQGEDAQPTPTRSFPIMADADATPIRITYNEPQDLVSGGRVYLNDQKHVTVVAGSSEGVDATAMVEVAGLEAGEFAEIWWRKEWKKSGEADVDKGGNIHDVILPRPGRTIGTGQTRYAESLPKAAAGWTACLRLMYSTNSKTAKIVRRQIRGWKLP